MCIICRAEFHGLENVRCYCPELKQIPLIPGLKVLDCSHCPELEHISLIPGLEELYCSDCPKLKQIPQIPGMKYLNCARCPLLTSVPWIDTLTYLFCEESRSLTQIPEIPGLEHIFDTQCVWLKPRQSLYYYDHFNEIYMDRIQKLKILQKWFRGVLMNKKLLRLIPQLMPLYYHPSAKGGYFHKKEMLDFMSKI